MVWVSWSAQESGVTILRGVGIIAPLQLQLIHALHSPLDGPFRAMNFKGHITFGPIDDTARFQHSTCAVFKMYQRTDIILVGHLAHRTITAPNVVMGTTAWLRERTSLDKDCFVTTDTRDRACQHMGHIDHMRHQVPKGPQPLLLLKAPGEEAVGITRIAVKKATMIVSQSPQSPLSDKLPGVLDEWRPAIVVADKRQHPSLASSSGTLDGFLGIPSDWFLTQDVFPRLGRGPVNLQVHPIGRSHVDDLNCRVGDHLMPIGRGALKTKTLLGCLYARLHCIGAGNQSWDNPAFMKTVWYGAIRAAMYLAHPAHANHPDTDGTCHGHPSILLLAPLTAATILSGLPVGNLHWLICMQ